MHYSAEQLKRHAAEPDATIAEHLQSCPDCYEKSLLLKVVEFQRTQSYQAKPSEVFLKRLDVALSAAPPKRSSILKRPIFWAPALAAACLLVAVRLLFFQPPFETRIVFSRGEVWINGKPPLPGQKILPNDELKTAEESMAIVAFDKVADLTILPASSVTILSVRDSGLPEIKIRQNSGYVYSRVAKEKSRYWVSAGTLDTEVRGTQFAINLNHADGQVKLTEGRLVIRNGRAEVNLTGGSSVQNANGKLGAVQNLLPRETRYAACFDAIPFPAGAALTENGLAPEKVLALLEGEGEPWLLRDIKRKYKKLSTIYTRDGKKLVGGFYSKDKNITIQTEKAKVRLPLDAVAKIIPFENR